MNELITKLINEIGPGHMGSTAYDTAWAARLGEIDWGLASRSLSWLSENQSCVQSIVPPRKRPNSNQSCPPMAASGCCFVVVLPTGPGT